jgi:SAM-dependent methyltransferase
VEGFYVAQIALALHRRGVFQSLRSSRTAGDLAREFGYDAEALASVLDFVYRTTDLLVRNRRGEYRLARRYEPYPTLGFHLDKFLGAYGGPTAHLEDSLRRPARGRRLVDRSLLAKAFAKAETGGPTPVAAIVRGSGVRSLLDLGCGTAPLLRELCSADRVFRGWAVDADPAMCAAAAEKIKAAGLTDCIRVIHADVRRLGTALRPRERAQVEAIFGSSLLNELCRAGGRETVRLLSRLRRLFPGRQFFVVDYYGKLTYDSSAPARYRHTLLQDLVQALTAQGVPPPDLASWAELYSAAGCELLKAYEGETGGIEWFLHVVQL